MDASQAAAQPVTRSSIPGLRKAAILMVAVGDATARKLCQSLPKADVQMVADEIARLTDVSKEELAGALTDFCTQMTQHEISLRGGPGYAARILSQTFGQEQAEEMILEGKALREKRNGDLTALQKMDPQQLSKFLQNEHPQTVALVLAHLDGKKGSGLLTYLDPKLRVETVRRLAEMRQFSPETAQTVGAILHKRMESVRSTGRKSYAGFKAVAEVLNRLDGPASKSILEEIEREDPKIALGIRNQMFTFEDLLTVPEASIREIVAAADKRALAIALKSAKEDLKAHLFKAMSSRAVEMLKDDMEAMGPLRSKEISTAQQELLTLARSLEAEGRVTLRMEADDEPAA